MSRMGWPSHGVQKRRALPCSLPCPYTRPPDLQRQALEGDVLVLERPLEQQRDPRRVDVGPRAAFDGQELVHVLPDGPQQVQPEGVSDVVDGAEGLPPQLERGGGGPCEVPEERRRRAQGNGSQEDVRVGRPKVRGKGGGGGEDTSEGKGPQRQLQ